MEEEEVEEYVARSAQLAMLLEVSSYPKPGNVDRTHDFEDTSYEHFLASSVAVYPVLREAAKGQKGIGELVRRGVEESIKWQRGGNTHFGVLLLLIPLAMAAGASNSNSNSYERIKEKAKEIMLNSSVEDAIEVYKAFPPAKVKVRRDVEKFSVLDSNSIREIREKKLTLYDILSISASYDLISRELVGGFEKSFQYASLIKNEARSKNINDTISHSYLMLLSEGDTFVEMKFGIEKSKYVAKKAARIVNRGYERKEIEEFDDELIRKGINPGSTADIIVAALFLAILTGLRI